MSYCPRNATRSFGFKDSTHWLDQALSFAYSLGLNRQLDEERSGHRKQSLDRRIWWALFIQDRVTGLRLSSDQRRPVRIQPRDCKISMVSLDDFDLDDFGEGQKEVESLRMKESAMMFVEKAMLCWSSHNAELLLLSETSAMSATGLTNKSLGAEVEQRPSTRVSSPFDYSLSTHSTGPHLSLSMFEESTSPRAHGRPKSSPSTDFRIVAGSPGIETAAREYSDYLEYIGEAMSGKSSSPMDIPREAILFEDL